MLRDMKIVGVTMILTVAAVFYFGATVGTVLMYAGARLQQTAVQPVVLYDDALPVAKTVRR